MVSLMMVGIAYCNLLFFFLLASRGAPFTCFDEINSRGDRYGNCGSDYCAFSYVFGKF